MVTRKLQIAKEARTLIEGIIRENPKFIGNEELLDMIVEAAYKKSYLLIDAIKDRLRLKRHLAVICESAIDQIIKEKERFSNAKAFSKQKRTLQDKTEIVSLKKSPLEENELLKAEFERQKLQGIVNLKEEIQRSEKYDAVDVLIDPRDFCPQKRVSEKTLMRLIEVIQKVDKKYPNKQYYNIFTYRYVKRFDQMQIARELKMSQVELSKRFVEMIKLARQEV